MSETSKARTRRRGGGSITPYQLKSGRRWRWQLSVNDPESGKTKQVGRGGFRTSAEAGADMERYRRDIASIGAPRKTSGIPTVGEYAEQWVNGLRLASSTVYGYRKIIRNHVVPQIGSLRIDRLTSVRIRAHYDALLSHGRADGKDPGGALSANTVAKVHAVIGSILDAAVEDGLIASNPARRRKVVQAPTGSEIRAQKPVIQTWTRDELSTFLRWDRDMFRDDLFPLWHVVAMTGLRRSEAIALRWEDVELSTRRLVVRRAADTVNRGKVKFTKTHRVRVIELDDETIAVLRSHRANRGALALDLARPDAYVFGNRFGEIRSANEVSRRWTYRVGSAREFYGDDALRRITLHGLRHTHATLFLEIGEHPRVVQERLGHATAGMTLDTYSHVTPTMQRSAIDNLASAMKRAN